MSRIAANFFYDLSDWLADYHIILAARITDPAKTKGKFNLTSCYLTQVLRESGKVTEEIEKLSMELLDYRSKIIDWRNKIIAHSDLETAVKPGAPSSHDISHVESFHAALDRFCLAVGESVDAQRYSTIRVAQGSGGAAAFVMSLNRYNRSQNDR